MDTDASTATTAFKKPVGLGFVIAQEGGRLPSGRAPAGGSLTLHSKAEVTGHGLDGLRHSAASIL
jgi:hypothetical protein